MFLTALEQKLEMPCCAKVQGPAAYLTLQPAVPYVKRVKPVPHVKRVKPVHPQ